MNPASLREYDVNWPSDLVPAFCAERADRTATAWHPSGRADHPNLLLLVGRLQARGFAVSVTVRGEPGRMAA